MKNRFLKANARPDTKWIYPTIVVRAQRTREGGFTGGGNWYAVPRLRSRGRRGVRAKPPQSRLAAADLAALIKLLRAGFASRCHNHSFQNSTRFQKIKTFRESEFANRYAVRGKGSANTLRETARFVEQVQLAHWFGLCGPVKGNRKPRWLSWRSKE